MFAFELLTVTVGSCLECVCVDCCVFVCKCSLITQGKKRRKKTHSLVLVQCRKAFIDGNRSWAQRLGAHMRIPYRVAWKTKLIQMNCLNWRIINFSNCS